MTSIYENMYGRDKHLNYIDSPMITYPCYIPDVGSVYMPSYVGHGW